MYTLTVTLTTRALLKSISKVNQARQTEIDLLPYQHIWRCLQDITIDHEAALRELEVLMVDATPQDID